MSLDTKYTLPAPATMPKGLRKPTLRKSSNSSSDMKGFAHNAKGSAANNHLSLKKNRKYAAGKDKVILRCAHAMLALNNQRKTLLSEKAAFDAKYVAIDAKGASSNPYADKLELIDLQISALKESAISALDGANNYECWLPAQWLFASTVTTGVTNSVVTVKANDFAPDFTALAGLFEEYKMTDVDYHFGMGVELATASTAPANATTVALSMTLSTNNSALAGSVPSADDGLGKIYLPVAINTSGRPMTQPHEGFFRFKAKIPEGVLGATGPLGSGEYLVSSDTTTPFGYMKVYCVCATTTATANAVNGVAKVKFHFRIRI